jgi:membrane protein implicated in regulation of membrane protease activity
VGIVYLIALIFGVGLVVVPVLLAAEHGGQDHDFGHDFGHDAGDGEHGHAVGDHSSLLLVVLSFRFWGYSAFAFGLSGSALHYLGLASPLVTLIVATLAGLGSGFFAALTLRALRTSTTSSSSDLAEATGKVGRMVLSCAKERPGKVRLELRGSTVDVIATTDEGEIATGRRVVVVEVRGTDALVALAPDEGSPP